MKFKLRFTVSFEAKRDEPVADCYEDTAAIGGGSAHNFERSADSGYEPEEHNNLGFH